MDESRQVFAPSQELLQAVIDAQSGAIKGRAKQAQTGFDQSIRDIVAQQQSKGIDFKGFQPDEQARLFGTGQGALGTQQAQADFAGTQLGGVLAGLQSSRERTGVELGDQERARRQRLGQERAGFRSSEDIARQRADTQIQASQIREARAAEAQKQKEQDAAMKQLAKDAAREIRINLFSDEARGPYGFVSPITYGVARQDWINAGLDPLDFEREFAEDFVNPSHSQDYTLDGFEELLARREREAAMRAGQQPPSRIVQQMLPGRKGVAGPPTEPQFFQNLRRFGEMIGF